MRVLAIDTALEACSVGVLDTARADVLALESVPMHRGHAEALMSLVGRVLDRCSCRKPNTIGPRQRID